MSIRMESILEARDLGVVLAIITSSLGETAGHSLWLLPRRSVVGTADPGAGRYPTHPRNKGLPSHMTQFSQQLHFFFNWDIRNIIIFILSITTRQHPSEGTVLDVADTKMILPMKATAHVGMGISEGEAGFQHPCARQGFTHLASESTSHQHPVHNFKVQIYWK